MSECKPWVDLPRGIRGLVLSELPWVMSHERMSTNVRDTYTFRCELFDPYSQKVREALNSIKKFKNFCSDYVKVYASKHGWVLMGGERSALFLHNPFTNDIILLPNVYHHFESRVATFNKCPPSPECEVFMLTKVDDYYLHISTYCLSKDKEWSTQFLEITGEQLYSVHYMKEELYCLFEDGALKRYKSEDESWKSLTSSFPEAYRSCDLLDNCWVTEIGEKLIVVRRDREDDIDKWMTFRFDWSGMCWVIGTSFKSCAFFVSGNVLWSSPLKDGNGENLDDCRVFYFDEYDGDDYGYGFKCCSLKEGEGRLIQAKEYSWIKRQALCEMSFIEPPYVSDPNLAKDQLFNQQLTRHWEDLPQGILGIFLNKLHFADQIRFCAVCKSWLIPKDGIRCFDCLPFVMSHEKISSTVPDTYTFTCELFDPYSQKVHKFPSSIGKFNGLYYHEHLKVYASKKSWLLIGGERSSLFLHNPFTNDIILLPNPYHHFENIVATFNTSPSSPGCEIFMLGMVNVYYLHIATYCLSKDSDWNTQFLEIAGKQLYSVHCMKGELYCLFEDGVLQSYRPADESWNLLTSNFPENYPSCSLVENCWLTEIKENLIMVRKDRGRENDMNKWLIFRFNSSKKRWVVETSLKSCAFFISGSVLWSAPLKDENGKNIEDCRLFYFDEYDGDDNGFGFKCYSLNEGKESEIVTKEYSWIKRNALCEISFIEPPYFVN